MYLIYIVRLLFPGTQIVVRFSRDSNVRLACRYVRACVRM